MLLQVAFCISLPAPTLITVLSLTTLLSGSISVLLLVLAHLEDGDSNKNQEPLHFHLLAFVAVSSTIGGGQRPSDIHGTYRRELTSNNSNVDQVEYI
jgi:hypothetical protein